MKRILFILFAILACQLTSAHSFSVRISGGKEIYFKILSSTTVAVTFKEGSNLDNSNVYKGHITIPSEVTYDGTTYSVTSIGDYAFSGSSSLTSVTIPNSVTSIGDYAFKFCSGLTEVTIGNSVTSIGNHAFYECSCLTAVTIPNSVTSIGYQAFYGCSGLTSVTIPNSVTSIGRGAFYGCTGLTEVTIPNSVTSIGNYAFYGCSGLKEVTIGNSVTSIGDYAFQGCSGLKEVTIPNSVTSIGKYAFYECSCLTAVTIPNSVTSIGDFAFQGCTGLTQVTIGNSVTSIGNYAFKGCTGLTQVTIPNSVTSIGRGAFYGCTGLTEVTIPNSVTSIGNYAFYECSCLTAVTIPNSVTSIGYGAFEGCTGLKTLIIEDGDTELSLSTYYLYPFSSCKVENLYVGRNLSSWAALCTSSSLKQVTIGNYVTSIGDEAFSGCTGLTEVTIPESVTSIGSYAFYGCTGLTQVTIPNSVTYIGSRVLDGYNNIAIDLSGSKASITNDSFTNIKSLIVGENVSVSGTNSSSGINVVVWLPNCSPSIKGNVTYTSTDLSYLSSFFKVDGYTYVPLSPSERTCMAIDCDYITTENAEIIIPEKVTYRGIDFNITRLGSYLMARQSRVSSVTLRESEEVISNGMFSKCSNLSNITIPNSVTSIGRSAFYGCTGLTEVTIPNSVTSIGDFAFQGCTGLTQVTIGNSVTSIGNYAFQGCTGLTQVTIPNSVTSIGNSAFLSCTGLTEVTIPNSVTSIGRGAFEGCTGLTEVTIPNSVTSIGDFAFDGCTGLTQVTIGNSITSIGSYAFFGCTGLTQVIIPNSVTSIGSSAFEGCTSLTEVSIPNSVTSINGRAFYCCTGLTSFIFEEGEKQLNLNYSFANSSGLESVIIGRPIKTLKDGYSYSGSPFSAIESLETAIIPDVPTAVSDYLFYNCSSLKNVYIGDNVRTIGTRAFSGCSSLTLFQFGKNITSIGADALSDCSSIKDIYAEPLTPPSVGNQGLDDLDRWSCTIHVPASAMDAYKAASQWKDFFFYDSDFAITLSDELINLEPGQAFQLKAFTDSEHTSRAASAIDSDIRWMSTNPKVAVVDQNGMVVGTGVGKCSILAINSDNVMANCMINIDANSERTLTLDCYDLQIKVNEQHQFEPNVEASTLTWTSSNPEVAEVDSNGLLTAKAEGITLVTATNTAGDNVSCLVNVNFVTGIEDIAEKNTEVTISVEGGEIVIEGLADAALVHVLTIDGRLIYSGYNRRISLQPNTVYIVVYPGGYRKIVLR